MRQLMGELIKNKTIFSLWLLFLIALTLTSLHTTEISSTISSLIHYYFSFLMFTLPLSLFKSTKYHSKLVFSVIGVTIVFLFFSGYLYFQPQRAELLSLDNMFYPTFGHNHLAEWLLLVLPLSWWLAIEKKNKILYFLPIILTVGLWFSYGRLVMSIGLLELLAIAWLYRTRRKGQISSGEKIILGLLFTGFISVLISGALVSATNQNVCKYFHLQKLLCKTTEFSNRTYYWQQAIAIWKENPIVGTGLGTFYNQSLKYVQIPGFQSDYAHNIVLQLLAETGLVGTIPFVLLFSYLLIRVTRIAFSSKSTLSYILLIAVYASYINAMVDFSWSYLGIFYLTILMIVMLLSYDEHTNEAVTLKKKKASRIVLFLILVCVGIAGILSAGYSVANIFTSFQLMAYPDKIPNRYMKYLKQFKKEYTKLAIVGSEEEKKELFKLYNSDQGVLRELLLSTSNDVEINLYQKQMFALDPWYALAFFDAETYLKNNTVDQAIEQVDVLIDFIDQKKDQYKYIPRYETEIDFTNSVLEVADELFKRGEYQKSAEYYVFAQKIDPWVLSKHQPVIADSEIVTEQVDFIRAIESADVVYFGEYQATYGTFALDLLWLSIEQGMYLEAEDLLALSQRLLPWDKWELWDEVLQVILEELSESEPDLVISFMERIVDQYRDEITTYSDYQLREKVAQQLQRRAVATARNNKDNKTVATIQSIRAMQKLFGEDYWVATQLANYYVLIGDLEKATAEFDVCLQKFNNQHDDCAGGKQAILEGNPNKERYYQVSQIILGEKRWQDFQ